ncbi:Putative transporter C83.11 [Verticillium dahliae VDG2]|nr:Putative transporter C83.11 [Verticillium dahliae VDG2]
MAIERDTIRIASDEEERDSIKRRQLRPKRKPSNKAIDNRAIDNEAIDNQATDDATDDTEVTKRSKGRSTKSTVRRPTPGTSGGQLDGRTLLRAMEKQMELQTKIIRKVLEESQSQSRRIKELQNEVEELRKALHTTTNEAQSLRTSIEANTTTIARQDRSEPSYADIAQIPPAGQLSNTRQATTTTPTDTHFYTIDTSRIEGKQDK